MTHPHEPQAWRSEAFVEDLYAEADADPAVEPGWDARTVVLCALPITASMLGGAVAFLQTLA